MPKQKKSLKKGKKPHKNKPTSQKWKFYKVEGDKISRGKYCPRCGLGVFLAKSKSGDKLYCGKCHYTEFLKKEKSNENH
jgi:ribosomal protein S27AE